MRANRIKTLLGFFVLPVISMIAALVAIPVLVTTGGTAAWASVAIAQGIGSTAALIVLFGWGTVGPAQVAESSRYEQRHIYWLSVVTRFSLLTIALPAAILVTIWLVPPVHLAVAIAVCTAITVQGLSPGWFLVGQARPLAIAAMETGPRALAQLVSIAAVIATQDLLWYGVILLGTELALCLTAAVLLGARARDRGTIARQVLDNVAQQWPLALAALVGSGYTRAAVPIVSTVAYPAVAVFASIDRVQLLCRSAIRPLISFFQGWVGRTHPQGDDHRAIVATGVTIGAGVLVGSAVTVFLPTVAHILFTDEITISGIQALLLGVTIVSVSASYSTGLYYLVPLKAIRVLSSSSVVGSLTGVPMVFIFSQEYGATGAILAMAIAEALVVAWQVLYLVLAKKAH